MDKLKKSLIFRKVGMAIFDQPAGTRPGPTLMGRVLLGPIRNRVGYGFLKLKKKKNLETLPKTQPR